VKWCSWRACEGGREGGKRKGRVTSVMPFIGVAGGRGRKGGVRGGVRVEERDGWREGAQVRRLTAGTGP
jgi:hypothetical protein